MVGIDEGEAGRVDRLSHLGIEQRQARGLALGIDERPAGETERPFAEREDEAAGARIVATSGDIDGDANDPTVVFVRQIMDAVAELERKQIAARTRDSMRQHQANGRRMGRYAPYGWQLDPVDPAHLIPEPLERVAVKRVKELGGEARKVQWIGRRGAPDRVVMLPWGSGRTVWVELKATGVKPEPHQVREHNRMRAMGHDVVVIDSIDGVEALFA